MTGHRGVCWCRPVWVCKATKRRQDERKNSTDSYGRAMALGLAVNAHTCRWEPPGAWRPSAGHFLLREASGWTQAGLRGGRVEQTCKSRMSEKRNFAQSCRPECCVGYPGWPGCSLCWRTFISACFSCSVWNVCLSVRSCCLCCSSCTITHTIIPPRSALKSITTSSNKKNASQRFNGHSRPLFPGP